ncbi:MAG: ankyrin repeat domain-containing protein [Candidatus Krumholzibacteriota bacterium]|nr:ankyrin repeat domain-containing protein [Candidatus Krumholzibacteriota bacterium]
MTRKLLLLSALLALMAASAAAGEIHEAIAAGELARVTRLLEADPGLLTRPNDNRFHDLPLHAAVYAGQLEIARLLLDKGADIDAGDADNSTPLGCAAVSRQREMAALLIERGADINRRDNKGDCPLSFAVSAGDTAIVGMLLSAGADHYFRGADGRTLLHLAAASGMRGLVERMLERGEPVDAATAHGMTPLTFAARGGRVEIAELLLDRGARVETEAGGHAVRSPLATAVDFNRVEMARFLLERGADVSATFFDDEDSLLYLVAWRGSPEMARLLVEHGADVNYRNAPGETALYRAAFNGNTAVAAVLIEAGARLDAVECPIAGNTLLHLAAARGQAELARVLLDAGAPVAAENDEGETPAQLAARYGHADLLELLAARGGESLAQNPACTLAGQEKVGKGEAVVWYMGHSGWAVKTRRHLLVFDYWPNGPDPAHAGLRNGRIAPAEIAGEDVIVLVSHEHSDHYDPVIFTWREQVPEIRYLLGCRPEGEAPEYVFLAPRMAERVGDLRIRTITSTDLGVGTVVEVDGLVLFHAGDHANGALEGFDPLFQGEIDWLAEAGVRPDIAFLGIRGCSLGRPASVARGVRYMLETLKPRVFVPQHVGLDTPESHAFIAECRDEFPGVDMEAPTFRGDHFRYADGELTRLDGSVAGDRAGKGIGCAPDCAARTAACSER